MVAQDTSRYGTDFPEHKRLLPELLRQLCQIDGLHWIRVHYVYPDEIDDELIEVTPKNIRLRKKILNTELRMKEMMRIRRALQGK